MVTILQCFETSYIFKKLPNQRLTTVDDLEKIAMDFGTHSLGSKGLRDNPPSMIIVAPLM